MELPTCSALPLPTRLFLCLCTLFAQLLVSVLVQSRERVMGTGKIKTQHTILFKIQLPFLNRYSLDSCKPLVDFQSSESLTVFLSSILSHCFYEEDFLCPTYTIPEVISYLLLLLENLLVCHVL